MMPPRPPALRLVTRLATRTGGRPPRPPLGLETWSPDADAVAVLLDATQTNLDDPAQLVAQIPRTRDLPPATLVFVLGTARRGGGLWSWMGIRGIAVGRAARCTALVARGYVGVRAAVDDETHADLAWGFSSPG